MFFIKQKLLQYATIWINMKNTVISEISFSHKTPTEWVCFHEIVSSMQTYRIKYGLGAAGIEGRRKERIYRTIVSIKTKEYRDFLCNIVCVAINDESAFNNQFPALTSWWEYEYNGISSYPHCCIVALTWEHLLSFFLSPFFPLVFLFSHK